MSIVPTALSCAGLVGGGEAGAEVFPADPSLPLRAAEAARVRCAVLCCAAYTFLCLGEYQQALGHATALLAALPPPDSAVAAGWAAANPALMTYRLLQAAGAVNSAQLIQCLGILLIVRY